MENTRSDSKTKYEELKKKAPDLTICAKDVKSITYAKGDFRSSNTGIVAVYNQGDQKFGETVKDHFVELSKSKTFCQLLVALLNNPETKILDKPETKIETKILITKTSKGSSTHSDSIGHKIIWIEYNSEMDKSTGVERNPYLGLAHELVHAYRHIAGCNSKKDDQFLRKWYEENETTGVEGFGYEIKNTFAPSENIIRDELGEKRRTTYYSIFNSMVYKYGNIAYIEQALEGAKQNKQEKIKLIAKWLIEPKVLEGNKKKASPSDSEKKTPFEQISEVYKTKISLTPSMDGLLNKLERSVNPESPLDHILDNSSLNELLEDALSQKGSTVTTSTNKKPINKQKSI